MYDLLVTGFDLSTGQEVFIDDAPRALWDAKGINGDQTLVCLLCYLGIDAPPGTRVPLVPRGRIGGPVRDHFAHPPGQAPKGGHNPETLWHLSAKHVLARWAEALSNVAAVRVEPWLPDRARRTDVGVELDDGTQIALEVQHSRLTDRDWLARHQDYRSRGIVDVWLWDRETEIHRVVLTAGQHLWYLDPRKHEIGIATGEPHPRNPGWHNADRLDIYAPHCPPCVNDTLTTHWMTLTDVTLTPSGIAIPTGHSRDARRGTPRC